MRRTYPSDGAIVLEACRPQEDLSKLKYDQAWTKITVLEPVSLFLGLDLLTRGVPAACNLLNSNAQLMLSQIGSVRQLQ
jgi:hypothetical protein